MMRLLEVFQTVAFSILIKFEQFGESILVINTFLICVIIVSENMAVNGALVNLFAKHFFFNRTSSQKTDALALLCLSWTGKFWLRLDLFLLGSRVDRRERFFSHQSS